MALLTKMLDPERAAAAGGAARQALRAQARPAGILRAAVTSENGLEQAEAKMRDAGQPEEAIRAFANAYRRLESGDEAMLPSADLEPAGDVSTLEELPEVDGDALGRVAVIKLNGGLATSMGLRSPKSLIEARAGRSFLDIIIGNTLALRARYGVRLPLVLMNSQATRADTLKALESHPDLDTGLPVHFLQSMEPKLEAESLAPVSWPADPSLEWCPPGHGDVYGSLRSSGMLDALIEDGFRVRDDLERRQPRRDGRRADRESP